MSHYILKPQCTKECRYCTKQCINSTSCTFQGCHSWSCKWSSMFIANKTQNFIPIYILYTHLFISILFIAGWYSSTRRGTRCYASSNQLSLGRCWKAGKKFIVWIYIEHIIHIWVYFPVMYTKYISFSHTLFYIIY